MGQPVVLDLETKHSFKEIHSTDPSKLGVSVVGLYSYETDTYRAFKETEFYKLFPILERSSLIIGFNIKEFDLPALKSYYPGNLLKLPSLDLLEETYRVLGKRIALNEFAHETLKVKKSGHGLLAIDYYREGKWDELIRYCLDDVKITKELYEYGKEKGVVYYLSLYGRREIKVNWNESPRGDQVNLTLGI